MLNKDLENKLRKQSTMMCVMSVLDNLSVNLIVFYNKRSKNYLSGVKRMKECIKP